MKRQIFPLVLVSLLVCVGLLFACGEKKQVQQFNVVLSFRDGTKEAYPMLAGSVIYVHDGPLQLIAQAVKGTENELELEVTSYTVATDTVKKESTVRKESAMTKKLSVSKNELLDQAGTVQVTLNSVNLVNTGNNPKGACKGNCCEAKCFSTWCCSDPNECKDVPCDCKPPSNCPGQPLPDQTALFFEIFKSGKDVMVFKI